MAGGAADCSQFLRATSSNIQIQAQRDAIMPNVKMIAKLFARYMRSSRGSDLSVGTMIAGWDPISEYSSTNMIFLFICLL